MTPILHYKIKSPYFIIVLGSPAAGKMTVGQEISKLTGFKLFHNHLVIEALLPIFDFNSEPFNTLSKEFRHRIFEEVIDSELQGLIYTFVPNFKKDSSIKSLFEWIKLFAENNYNICIVELKTSLETRLYRNETPNRLAHKFSKRDIGFSRQILLQNEEEWDMNVPENFFQDYNFLKIENDDLTPNEVANIVMQYFNLPKLENQ